MSVIAKHYEDGFAGGENQLNRGKAWILGVCRWLQAWLTIARVVLDEGAGGCRRRIR